MARLRGNPASVVPSPQDAQVWAEAARFLSARIQGSPGECPGRNPDMSSGQAEAMRAVLGEIEAAAMLIANREKVVKDITNPGPNAIGGGTLTQPDLKRVPASSQATVEAMIREVSGRLLGNRRLFFNLFQAITPVPV